MKVFFVKRHNFFTVLLLILLVAGSITYTSLTNEGDITSVFSAKRELPIYSVKTDEKKVAISFDAAWGSEYTDEILNILDKHNVKTTFFLVGFWVDRYPEMVKKIDARGHEIGNHSSHHPHMSKLSEKQITEELLNTEEKIKKITGKETMLFRPPFGDYNDRLIKTCRDNGYYTIQWDVDSLDWKELGVQPVVDRVTRNVKKGSIILFHNNAKYVTEYLPLVLSRLQEQGYEIVPISELIYKNNYHMDSTGQQVRDN